MNNMTAKSRSSTLTGVREFDSGVHPSLHCYLVADDSIFLQCVECKDIVIIDNDGFWKNLGKGETIIYDIKDGRYYL